MPTGQTQVKASQSRKLSDANFSFVQSIVDKPSEVESFFGNFFDEFRPMLSIMEFREFKIISCPMSLSQFAIAFQNERKEALRKLFREPITSNMVRMLESKFSDSFGFAELFQRHLDSPFDRMLRFVL